VLLNTKPASQVLISQMTKLQTEQIYGSKVQPKMFIFPHAFILSFWWIEDLVNVIEVVPYTLLNKLRTHEQLNTVQ